MSAIRKAGATASHSRQRPVGFCRGCAAAFRPRRTGMSNTVYWALFQAAESSAAGARCGSLGCSEPASGAPGSWQGCGRANRGCHRRPTLASSAPEWRCYEAGGSDMRWICALVSNRVPGAGSPTGSPHPRLSHRAPVALEAPASHSLALKRKTHSQQVPRSWHRFACKKSVRVYSHPVRESHALPTVDSAPCARPRKGSDPDPT